MLSHSVLYFYMKCLGMSMLWETLSFEEEDRRLGFRSLQSAPGKALCGGCAGPPSEGLLTHARATEDQLSRFRSCK